MSYIQDYERHAYVGFVQRVIEKKIRDHLKNVHGLQNIEIDVCYCESFSTRCMVYRAYVTGTRNRDSVSTVSINESHTLGVVMMCSGFTTIVELLADESEDQESH